MKIFNTLTREKEKFVPIEQGKVKMYACGPTVYNFIHIGNARPICVFDTMRRYLEFKGYDVTFVQNFTDIDDKIIKKANEEGVTAKEIAERYINEYLTDTKGLGIREATIHPKATETIDEIKHIVETLEDKGFAYEANGDVLFRTKKDPGYGKLSHQPLEELESGARISVGEHKEDPLDFVLWKSAKPGEPHWSSRWGEGRPGWHIECTAMIHKHLGETIDIHCGGQDLIFPHHENEIAQSECCTGKEYAHYWMHNGYINVDNKKMSKSLGNCIYLSDTEQEVKKKVMSMFTDPNHLRIEDPGQVEGNPVFIYLDAFSKQEHFDEFLPEYANLQELKDHYTRGGLGDVKVKKFLNKVLQAELEPIRQRRKEWEKNIPAVYEILREGSIKAQAVAAETLKEVKAAMRINYFDNDDMIREQEAKYQK